MDDSKLEELNIFTNLKITQLFGAKVKDKEIFLCGKMFEHVTQAKYTFKACDFFILFQNEIDSLYHSEMYSDDCFNGELKWNRKFFNKIRKYISTEIRSKNGYFSLNKNISQKDKEDSIGIEVGSGNDKLCLQLHLKIDNREFIVFRLFMNKYFTEKPDLFLFNKLLEIEADENQKIKNFIIKSNQIDKEQSKYKNDIKKLEEDFEKEKKSMIYKFWLLNEEKNKKKKELV